MKKLVYKFAQVEKKSKADREDLITQAREDIGKIQRNRYDVARQPLEMVD